MIAAALPQPTVNSGAAEIVLLVAGIVFTLVVIAVFGTVIVGALRAERRAEEQRRQLREQFTARRGQVGESDAVEGEGDAPGNGQAARAPEGPTR